MGLDLAIVKQKKNENFIWDNEHELAYGRKAWEICYELGGGGNPNGKYLLTHEDWDRLMNMITPIANKLPAIQQAYQNTCYGDKNPTPEQAALMREYKNWYDETWDESPTLGYDFSVGYMMNFWEAKDTVNVYLDNPNYNIWIVVSY